MIISPTYAIEMSNLTFVLGNGGKKGDLGIVLCACFTLFGTDLLVRQLRATSHMSQEP